MGLARARIPHAIIARVHGRDSVSITDLDFLGVQQVPCRKVHGIIVVFKLRAIGRPASRQCTDTGLRYE
jgi:hypothetical protein